MNGFSWFLTDSTLIHQHPPAALIFRDAIKPFFLRPSVNDEEVKTAIAMDHFHKQSNKQKIYPSKYRKISLLKIGDRVLQKKQDIRHTISCRNIWSNWMTLSEKLTLKKDDSILLWHPDNVKLYKKCQQRR